MGFLFAELLRRHAGSSSPSVHAKLVESLCLYDWPGNLRELDQVVHRLTSLHGDKPLLGPEHLPPSIQQSGGVPHAPRASGGASDAAEGSSSCRERRPRRSLQRAQLERALRATQGNVQRAADELGIRRQEFYRFFSKDELLAFRSARRRS